MLAIKEESPGSSRSEGGKEPDRDPDKQKREMGDGRSERDSNGGAEKC